MSKYDIAITRRFFVKTLRPPLFKMWPQTIVFELSNTEILVFYKAIWCAC